MTCFFCNELEATTTRADGHDAPQPACYRCADPDAPDETALATCKTCAKTIGVGTGTPCGVCGDAYCFEHFGDDDPDGEACSSCVKNHLEDERKV